MGNLQELDKRRSSDELPYVKYRLRLYSAGGQQYTPYVDHRGVFNQDRLKQDIRLMLAGFR